MKNPENLESEKIFDQTKTFGHAFYGILTGSDRIFDDFASSLRKPLHTFFFHSEIFETHQIIEDRWSWKSKQ